MTELVTLNLHEIAYDRTLLAKLHELQVQRLDEHDVTGGDRPVGLRLSISDPVRRVKAAFDPFWTIHIDDGVGARGHILEDYLEVALFHGMYEPLSGAQYESQVPIQWHKNGRSAFDFVATDVKAADLVVSCKTSSKGTRPSTDNVEQEERMMALAGYTFGARFDIWVIDPGTFTAVGPYEHTLSQSAIDAAQVELVNVTMAHACFESILTEGGDPTTHERWNDPASWLEHWNLESTSGAFRYTRLDANAAIEKRVVLDTKRRKDLADAKREADAAKALIEPHVREQIALARLGDPKRGIEPDPTIKSTKALGWVEGEVTYTLVETAKGGSYIKHTLKPHAEEQAA